MTNRLANAQRDFVAQTGRIPDKVGVLDYSDMIAFKVPFWGLRWRRGFFTLSDSKLYTMSMKGKVLRCYVLEESHARSGKPPLNRLGNPVGRPTIFLSDNATGEVTNVIWLKLKALTQQEHRSWLAALCRATSTAATPGLPPTSTTLTCGPASTPPLGTSVMHSPSPLRRQVSYEVIEEGDLELRRQSQIAEVVYKLNVETQEAVMLLRLNKWDTEQVVKAHQMEDCKVRASKPPRPPREEPKECQICMESFGPLSTTPRHLMCGHRFCNLCWVDFLTNAVRSGTKELWTKGSTCPWHGCSEPIPDEVYKELLPQDLFKRYQQYATNNFVDSNVSVRWCPASKCNRAVYCSDSQMSVRDVLCTCGMEFCFGCGKSPHSPAGCDAAARWRETETLEDQRKQTGAEGPSKRNEEDVLWLAKNTRPCPKCKVPIQKFHGCNHMTCHNQRCQHDFCWVCLRDWSEHGVSTGGYFHCNTNDPKQTREKLKQLRFEQNDAKSSGVWEVLLKRVAGWRTKARIAQKMAVDFQEMDPLEFDGDINTCNKLVAAASLVGRVHRFLRWVDIVLYDKQMILEKESQEQVKKGILGKAKKDVSVMHSLAADVLRSKAKSISKSVSRLSTLLEPMHRIFATTQDSRNGNVTSALSTKVVAERVMEIEYGCADCENAMIDCRSFTNAWTQGQNQADGAMAKPVDQADGAMAKPVERPSLSLMREKLESAMMEAAMKRSILTNKPAAATVAALANSSVFSFNGLFRQNWQNVENALTSKSSETWSCLLCHAANNLPHKLFCPQCLTKREIPEITEAIRTHLSNFPVSNIGFSEVRDGETSADRWSLMATGISDLSHSQTPTLLRRVRRYGRSSSGVLETSPSRPPALALLSQTMSTEREEQVKIIEDMGFTDREMILRALQSTNGNVESAVEIVLSWR